MYKRVESQIVLLGLSKKEIARKLGIAYNTLLAKLRGESAFTLDEAFAIKEVLKTQLEIEELFAKSQSEGAA